MHKGELKVNCFVLLSLSSTLVSWKPYRSKAPTGQYTLKNPQGVVYCDRTREVWWNIASVQCKKSWNSSRLAGKTPKKLLWVTDRLWTASTNDRGGYNSQRLYQKGSEPIVLKFESIDSPYEAENMPLFKFWLTYGACDSSPHDTSQLDHAYCCTNTLGNTWDKALVGMV